MPFETLDEVGCKDAVKDFLKVGLGATDDDILERRLIKSQTVSTTKFYGIAYVNVDFYYLRKILHETITEKFHTSPQSSGDKRSRGQRGGASASEMLEMLKKVVTGRPDPTPKTYFNNLIWLSNEAGKSFNVVYDLLHKRVPPKTPTENFLGRISAFVTAARAANAPAHAPAVPAPAAAALAAVARATGAAGAAFEAARTAGHTATVSPYAMPLRMQLFSPPDRLAMILIMIKNITPEEWVVIASVGYTAATFLKKMYDKLQEKLESDRAKLEEHKQEFDAKDKVDTDAQAAVFLKISEEFLKEYVDDIWVKDDLNGDVTDTSREAPKKVEEIMERVFTLLAADDADQDNDWTTEQQGEVVEMQRKRIATDAAAKAKAEAEAIPEAAAAAAAASGVAAAQAAAAQAAQVAVAAAAGGPGPQAGGPGPQAGGPGPQAGVWAGPATGTGTGGNRTMNRRKKSRRSKTIRKKRRLGKSIKKRKQFTKKRKARNKGKRKTRR